jgi:RNA polymerase sigma factor (TIGR02999 family)
MTSSTSAETPLSELLIKRGNGDADASAKLYALLYPDIKRIARSRLYEVGGITSFNTTALVNEGFLRIAGRDDLSLESRGQFFAYVGKVLRSVVLDYLRDEHAQKRGGNHIHVTLSQAESIAGAGRDDWYALDAAMEELQKIDLALYELVELRYFVGMTSIEIAKLRNRTPRTVDRDWAKAKNFLEEIISAAR